MTLPFIDGEELSRSLPISDAVEALAAAFASEERPEAPLRGHVELDGGDLLLMPAHGAPGLGVKLVTLNPGNPGRGLPLIHAVYVLFSPATLAPVAAIDGAALTALRTSAVSALATRHLARADASRLVLFGAGVQARAHLVAMRAVRPIRWVRVISRSPDRARRLADEAAAAGLDAAVAGTDAVAEADIVCTCTTSTTPVLTGRNLRAGAHVNAVGAYRPDAREVDGETVLRAALVAVETREAALAEAGDLVIPIERGDLDPATLVELGAVVRGERGRARPLPARRASP
ncbi:MAG TPA: ornithine cyclodeaminase family protein, partial [Actinomycetota bacterium]|nr:ornithine cyclodeaminase family protein [Actinomycetota bacterium]